MSESLEFFLILVAVYLWECMTRLPAGALVLQGPAPGRFSIRSPGTLVFQPTGGWIFEHPLPFGASTFVLSEWSDFSVEAGPAGLSSRMDPIAISQRYTKVAAAVRPARRLGALLLAEIFLLAPLLYVSGRLSTSWPWLVLAILGTHAWLVTQYVSSARELSSLRPARSESVLMSLSPLMSARAAAILERRAFEGFDPVATVYCLCDPTSFEEFTRDLLARVQDETASGKGRENYMEALEKLLRGAGLRVAQLQGPPQPGDSASRTFCPQCRSQYSLDSGSCPQCAVPLRKLDARVALGNARMLNRIRERQKRLQRKMG